MPARRPRPSLPSVVAALSAAVVAAGVGLATTAARSPASQSAAEAASPQAASSHTAARRVAGSPHAVAAALPRAASTTDSRLSSDSGLTSGVKSRMATSTAHAWSVVIDIAGKGRVVDVAGGTALRPASTEKLFTTLPILLNQPNRHLVTTIGSTKGPSRGVLHADLIVRSSGDPTLSGPDVSRLAKRLHDAGVRKVTGRLVLDIGGLPTARVRPGWKSSYVPSDIAPLSPFPVAGDRVSSTSGYLSAPTAGNLAFVRAQLKAAGVGVIGASVVARHVTMPREFVSHSSLSMLAIVRTTLLASVNFYAEQLLSIEGRAAVNATSNAAGVTNNTSSDGSGLSLDDRTTTRGEVALLLYAAQSAAASELRSALPVACRTGTLEKDLCAPSTAGQVWAKTGTLDSVKGLAGYTTDDAGRAVTFAILTNGDKSTRTAMAAMQKVLVLVRGYTH
jgi:D-alanyl-D-alanine carboxypeptidase/D-alanyl-D-alanine-endopeptidase (penicillin-binding protein 4)